MKDKRSITKNNKQKGKTVYIGNLSYKRNETGIRVLFSKFGKIKAIDIVKETGTEKSKGYGFVKMEHSRDALLAIESLNGSVVDGRTLKVSEASETKNNFKITKSYKKRSPIEEIEEEKAPQKKKNINHSKSGLHVLFDYLKN